MSSIIAPRPHGVNHPAEPGLRLPLDMRLRYQRRIRLTKLTNPKRPCARNASPWDENVTQEDARALCRGCPISTDCGTVAIIDEALVLANRGRGDSNIRNSVVSGTRGGMSARTRRPFVQKLAGQIAADRAKRKARAEAKARAEQASEAA